MHKHPPSDKESEYDPPNQMKRWVILVLVLGMLAAACFVGPDWMLQGPPIISNEML